MTIDKAKLKALAQKVADLEDQPELEGEHREAYDELWLHMHCHTILDLLSEIEGLRAQHGRDSAELRNLCQARDDARRESGQLKDENEVAKMRIKELDLLFGRYILAMRSAVIEEDHGLGAEAGMMWIYNSLVGPGELPPESETLAQAYFDREIVAIDNGMREVMAFHAARRSAMFKSKVS